MHSTFEQYTSTSQAIVVADGILVERALQGDQRAFESLVHRYSRSLLSYILLFLKDREHAYDVLQQTFLKLPSSSTFLSSL